MSVRQHGSQKSAQECNVHAAISHQGSLMWPRHIQQRLPLTICCCAAAHRSAHTQRTSPQLVQGSAKTAPSVSRLQHWGQPSLGLHLVALGLRPASLTQAADVLARLCCRSGHQSQKEVLGVAADPALVVVANAAAVQAAAVQAADAAQVACLLASQWQGPV